MSVLDDYICEETRRQLFGRGAGAVGWAALASLIGSDRVAAAERAARPQAHFAPAARNVIYLHMVGGPPQMDLYDYKPRMRDLFGSDLPESVRRGQRLTTMTAGYKQFPIAPSKFAFAQHGECGMPVCELLPWTARMVDDLCFIRSMHTEAINHEPALTYMQTGNQVTGKPCLGAWASYGLGSLNENLPTFVVLVAQPTNREQIQAISTRLWSAGFLPGKYAGVSFRTGREPILYLNNPPGVPSGIRRRMLDGLKRLNEISYRRFGDADTHTRIAQYELAFRMQSGVPALTDMSNESASTLALYGDDVHRTGTFAHTALLARRMVERGVRFIQIYHNNWDTHFNVSGRLTDGCRDIDQPCWALVQDLKQRGLLDETLIIWGGEFGRTIYSQGELTRQNYGRDHHPRCFTMWMAGGGSRPGTIYGRTDDFSYNIVEDPVHIHDFHATVLYLLGFDHERFTYRHQGLDQRLTDVEPARVIRELISS